MMLIILLFYCVFIHLIAVQFLMLDKLTVVVVNGWKEVIKIKQKTHGTNTLLFSVEILN